MAEFGSDGNPSRRSIILSLLATFVDKHFEEMTDPRLNRGLNHDLGELMFIALTAGLADSEGVFRLNTDGAASCCCATRSTSWGGTCGKLRVNRCMLSLLREERMPPTEYRKRGSI